MTIYNLEQITSIIHVHGLNQEFTKLVRLGAVRLNLSTTVQAKVYGHWQKRFGHKPGILYLI